MAASQANGANAATSGAPIWFRRRLAWMPAVLGESQRGYVETQLKLFDGWYAQWSKQPGALTFPINHRHLAGGVVVTEAEVFRAMRFAFEHLKIVAEPGGAVALAAVLAGKVAAKGGVIGVLISGGNVDPAVFARALAA